MRNPFLCGRRRRSATNRMLRMKIFIRLSRELFSLSGGTRWCFKLPPPLMTDWLGWVSQYIRALLRAGESEAVAQMVAVVLESPGAAGSACSLSVFYIDFRRWQCASGWHERKESLKNEEEFSLFSMFLSRRRQLRKNKFVFLNKGGSGGKIRREGRQGNGWSLLNTFLAHLSWALGI